MKYEKVWAKVLNANEEVAYEFSISERYRILGLVLWAIIGLPFLPSDIPTIRIMGFLILLGASFHYGFYIKTANVFAFTNKRVLIHRGWLSTNLVSVDYNKITDVMVNEPFLDRMVTHAGDLAINTAGTSRHEIVLRHIEFPYEVKKKLDALRS